MNTRNIQKSGGRETTTSRALRSIAGLVLTLCLAAPLYGQGPDRTQPPQVGAPPSLTMPLIRHLQLSGGLPVVLVEKHTVPVVQFTLIVKAGSVHDPEGKEGLASLAASMLMEGAGMRSSLELADAIDYLGARLSAHAGLHTSSVSLYTPLSKLDSALALMADVALRPTFPQSEVERLRKERLTELLQWRDEPDALAHVAFNRLLYPDHPYGRMSFGSERSIRAISAGDLKTFHTSYFRPNNATLVVVGDVQEAALVQKLEGLFSGWRPAAVPSVKPSAVRPVARREITLVDRPGSAQTVISIGCIGAQRQTEDYYALVVLNTILGGSFTSRLNDNLRERHGYTYGARSSFSFRFQPGPFLAGASVQTAVTDSALFEFMRELEGITKPIPDSELTKAKNYVALSYPADFQTVSQIAAQLEELVVYDLPDDYFGNYVKRILGLTRQEVESAAKKYINPGKMMIVLVGDRKQIEDGVRRLSLGVIRHATVEDVLGKAPVVQ
jgi:zinc protease